MSTRLRKPRTAHTAIRLCASQKKTVMDYNQSLKNINSISKINLYDDDAYERILGILNQTILPYFTVKLKANSILYRARRKDHGNLITTKDELSYRKDTDKILSFGRVNKPFQSMFYASHMPKSAIFESSSLIKENRNDIKKEKLIVGKWLVKEDVELIGIISNKDAIKKNTNLNKLYIESTSQEIFKNHHTKRILEYFSREFAKYSNGDSNNYKITTAYYNLIINRLKGKVHGIIYPSVGFEYDDINVALSPQSVDDFLLLNQVGEYSIDFNFTPKQIIQTGLSDLKKFEINYINE
ncbi:MAG: hypothetical protein ACOC1O_04180 [bacterium]